MKIEGIKVQSAVADALEKEPRPITLERVMELIEPLFERGIIEWYPGYARRSEGPQDQPVLAANWNTTQISAPAPIYWRDEPSRAMERIEAALSRVEGLGLEWCDEGAACNCCGRWIRTEPDSHDWKPAYRLGEDGFTCLCCAAEDEDA